VVADNRAISRTGSKVVRSGIAIFAERESHTRTDEWVDVHCDGGPLALGLVWRIEPDVLLSVGRRRTGG
jgi:hypothetical protein